jgi:hypothetical protein
MADASSVGGFVAGIERSEMRGETAAHIRHARPCAGHPRLPLLVDKDVDGRDKPGHDGV